MGFEAAEDGQILGSYGSFLGKLKNNDNYSWVSKEYFSEKRERMRLREKELCKMIED